jgi:arginyl-tRNA synthetase
MVNLGEIHRMDYALDRFEQQVRDAITADGRVAKAQVELATPKPNIPADLAFPAFRAAKELGIAPPALAQELASSAKFGAESLIGGVTATGPFLNFSIDNTKLVAAVLSEIEEMSERYGTDDLGKQQTVIVEYSSPNVAKRMHVGHIRTTIIGQSLFNIIKALGYNAISDNHLGDWGKQFGILLLAIEREGKPDGNGEQAVEKLEGLYSRYSSLVKEDAALDDAARAWSLKLEQGDPTARTLWEWCVEQTMQYINPLYDRLGVHFDTTIGESFFEDKMDEVIEKALATEYAHRDENGAVVVDLPDLPTFLLQRSDGGTLYQTRDVATVAYREREYAPLRVIYVVDSRQELHFRQVFAAARALNLAGDMELIHISFGTVFDANGEPFSTRKGNMIFLEALLNEARDRARTVVDRASADLPEAEKDAVAEAVGTGAVIYNDLYQDSKRNITLDWDRMLSTEGNSATYIQYMHARACSILRRANASEILGKRSLAEDAALLSHESEIGLIKQLARLPKSIREAGDRYAPFVIAEWCYGTARAFSSFYNECPVINAESAELRAARLRLVAASAQALKNGLALLGIKAPERM